MVDWAYKRLQPIQSQTTDTQLDWPTFQSSNQPLEDTTNQLL